METLSDNPIIVQETTLEAIQEAALEATQETALEVAEKSLSIDDFKDAFKNLGFELDDNRFYKSTQVTVGETVVNGQRTVNTVEERHEFVWLDFHGTLDDQPMCGFTFRVLRNNQLMVEDMCYMSPDDVAFFVKLYTGTQAN